MTRNKAITFVVLMFSILVCDGNRSFARTELFSECTHTPISRVVKEYDVLFYGIVDSAAYNPNELPARVNIVEFFIEQVVKGIPSDTKKLQMKIRGVWFFSDKVQLFAGKEEDGELIFSTIKKGCHSDEELLNYLRAPWFSKIMISISDYWMSLGQE